MSGSDQLGVLDSIPKDARDILELGCAAGRLGRALKERQTCRLTGVELDPQAAEEAKAWFDAMIVADLNSDAIDFPEGGFDAVVCEDVFERLKDPWKLMESIHRWLKPGGTLICSIYNVANLEIMNQLAAGIWNYAQPGALDRSHLRFFTRKEFLSALKKAGFPSADTQPVKSDSFAKHVFPEGQQTIRIDSSRLTFESVTLSDFQELTALGFLVTARKAGTEAKPAISKPAACGAPESGSRLVSIVLPFHGQPELTQTCLEHLAKNTNGDLFELILVRNASAAPEWLQALEGDVRIVTLDTLQGAGEAWNAGARLSTAKYLVFMHNDAFVQPGWLSALLDLAEKDDTIAAVSPRVVGPGGLLQSAGGMVFSNGEQWDFGRGTDPGHAGFNQACDIDVFSSACVLVRRCCFEQLGGFDPQFAPAYYEDADLCFGLRRLGWRVVYGPAAWVIHLEGRTTQALLAETPDILERQRGKFTSKWRDALAEQGPCPESVESFPVSADRGKRRLARVHLQPAAEAPAPLASLVVLAHNQRDYTRFCLQSILDHTRTPYELIVVDNASDDGTAGLLVQFAPRFAEASACRRFHVARSDRNLGFAGGNNLGMAAATGDVVVLLNNDLVFTPGWLERLLQTMARSPRAGIVGPLTNYASGPQWVQEPDYNTATLAGLNEYALRVSRDRAGQAVPSWRIVGFCLAIRRAVIEKIGGLDTRFGKGNFEDDDYCLRSLLAGFESWIAGDCFIHHFGSRTFAGANINYNQSLQANWEIFKAKWGIPKEIPYGGYYNFEQVVKAGFSPAHYCPLEPGAKPAGPRSRG